MAAEREAHSEREVSGDRNYVCLSPIVQRSAQLGHFANPNCSCYAESGIIIREVLKAEEQMSARNLVSIVSKSIFAFPANR